MQIFYYQDKLGNFGDDLNAWLWQALIPSFSDIALDVQLVGIGTILDDRLNQLKGNVVIFGTGVRKPDQLPNIGQCWQIYGVRGPLSAEALSLNKSYVIGDPAYLLRQTHQDSVPKKFKVSYMSHMSCQQHEDWQKLLAEIDIHYIRPDAGIDTVLHDIRASECLITEAMHGAIVADIFRVPFYPVKVYAPYMEGDVHDFKWQDWSLSVGLALTNRTLLPLWKADQPIQTLRKYIKIKQNQQIIKKILKTQPQLSRDEHCQYICDLQLERLEKLKKDYGAA